MSLCGGGTDFPEFYNRHGGAVVSTTIDKYCYVMVRELPPYFEYKHRIRYTKREEIDNIDDIDNPVVRECMRFMGVNKGLEIVHTADIPAMSGVGSSSSFTVGLLHSLYHMSGCVPDKLALAKEAIRVEREMIGDCVGDQDQIAASVGGLNLIEFSKHGHKVTPLDIDYYRRQYIQDRIMLFFTGFSRVSSELQEEHVNKIESNISYLLRMRDMAYDAAEMLEGDMSCFGDLLNDSWMFKRSLTKFVSNDTIDTIYLFARESGASGGKIMGSGGGGFMFLWCEPEKQDAVKAALGDLLYVPVGLENEGSKIIFNGVNSEEDVLRFM